MPTRPAVRPHRPGGTAVVDLDESDEAPADRTPRIRRGSAAAALGILALLGLLVGCSAPQVTDSPAPLVAEVADTAPPAAAPAATGSATDLPTPTAAPTSSTPGSTAGRNSARRPSPTGSGSGTRAGPGAASTGPGTSKAGPPVLPQAAAAPTSTTRSAAPTYRNCDEVRAAGAAPILRGAPGFAQKLDRDDDGIGCEWEADPGPPSGSSIYRNCAEVRAAGAAPLYRGQAGYAPKLDGDDDGVACEVTTTTTTTTSSAAPTTSAEDGPVSGPPYANCAEARAAGVTPIQEDDPGYSARLDGDDDGVACE